MLQGRIGNGAEDGLFRLGADELAESHDTRAARDDHDVDLGYWYREIAKSRHVELDCRIAE